VAEDPRAPEIRVTHDLLETGLTYWSPDGRELLYSTLDRKNPSAPYQVGVSTIDPATGQITGEHRIPMPAQVHDPRIAIWSPSGTQIAVEDAVSPTQRTLWILSRDGTHPQRVINYPSETFGGIAWTPDGTTLIYAALEGTRMQILSVARTGGKPHRLSDATGNDLNPRVSPDGRWIAASRSETVQTLQQMTLP
jgi:Tol biopolymer transport system component